MPDCRISAPFSSPLRGSRRRWQGRGPAPPRKRSDSRGHGCCSAARFMRAAFGLSGCAIGLCSLWLACGARTQVSAGADGGDVAGELGPSAVSGWDGGVGPSTPGAIRCGNGTCAAGTEECCLRSDGVPASNGCGSRGNVTCNGTQTVRRCDEAADCNQGELCCLSVFTSPPAILGSTCTSASNPDAVEECQADGAVGCGSDADCDALGLPPCVAQLCRGDILQTCGRLPSNLCDP